MPNKLIPLLLTVCMLFCLSACGLTATNSNTTDTPTELNADTAQDNDQITTTTSENEEVLSDAGNTKEDNIIQTKELESQRDTDKIASSKPKKKKKFSVAKENDNTTQQTQINQSKTSSAAKKNAHIHSYSNATCTSPKKCSCGATAGIALGHQFTSATCTSPQICSRCGITKGKVLGHKYSAANCNSPKTCKRCGKTIGSALGHNYENDKCSRCGKVDPDSLPVKLNDLYLVDSSFGNSWNKYEYRSGAFTDSFGNVYDGAHCYIGVLNDGQYSTHNLNGKYKNFKGSIVAMPNTSTAGTYTIGVYVDGVLKYSKSKFGKTTGKVDFSIDVKNGKLLTIKACQDSGMGDSNMDVAVVNAQLTK